MPNVLGEIGGIFSSIIIIGNLLVGRLNKTEFNLDVVNNLFYLSENKEFKNKILIVKSCENSINSQSHKNFRGNKNFNENKNADLLSKKSNFIKVREEKGFGNQTNNKNFLASNRQINDKNSQINLLHNIDDKSTYNKNRSNDIYVLILWKIRI